MFDHKYYYFLYRGYMFSLIGKCQSKKFNPINSNATSVLDEVHAYIKTYYFDESVDYHMMHELLDLFEKAVNSFKPIYIEHIGFTPENISGYLNLIDSLKKVH